MYYIYHIPGRKIGCTTNLQRRVTEQQGYKENEYEVLLETENIDEASNAESILQQEYGYKKDLKLYKNLFKKKMKKHTSSDATTTFKIPKSDLDGAFLADLEINTPYGKFKLDAQDKIDWVISNSYTSQFGPSTCYIYNKAMSEAGPFEKHIDSSDIEIFNKIRQWANNRDLISKGDVKTQLVKLYEETGELSQSILKDNKDGIIDAIGDCVVVLTNLAELADTRIEYCIDSAYSEISNRTGRMINGTFVKDA
jgi:NTP pyrophosphatase (non-canonical NTP hydrolase)